MKECPFMDECEDKQSESNFKAYCQVRFGIFFNYQDCYTYKKMLRVKQGKPVYQRPRDWKKEVFR